MKQLRVSLLFGVFYMLLQVITAAKILAIFPCPGPSQYINVLPFLKALAARGHDLTVINAFPQKTPIKNFHDLLVMEVHKIYDDMIGDAAEERSFWEENKYFGEFFYNVSKVVLANGDVQKLIKSKPQFDLVLVEVLRLDSIYGLGQHFNAPLIGFSTFGTDWNIDELVGNTSPLSYIPLVTSGLPDRMNYGQRLRNLIETAVAWAQYHLFELPKQEVLYKQNFPNAKVSVYEQRKNFSLILLNQHFSVGSPRPYVPSMIEVGGLHISHTPAPLPADIEKFIQGATHGVIYFSMGSNLKSKDLPLETRAKLLNVFGSLKQRVLWKFEDDQLPGKPDNVFIQKWFPQPDILAHENVKLFITHGGLLSTLEAVYHGKPVLGLPVLYDQFINVKRAVNGGYGLSLGFHSFQAAELSEAITRMFADKSFAQIAADMSKRYRDQPINPLERAIWWTEYVLRHKGAQFMRISGQELSFIAFHSWDTGALILGVLLVVLFLIVYLPIKLLCCLCKKRSKKIQKQKKH